jgi:predicted dehydrogenase
METIRLVVRGEMLKGYALAVPLRHATVTFRDAPLSQTQLADFDAIAFVQSDQLSIGEVQQLANFGKHILVAADACQSQQDLAILTALKSSAPVQIAVLNPVHFLPSRKLIRQRLESGKLGVPGLVRIHSWWPAGKSRTSVGTVPLRLLCELEFAVSLFREAPQRIYAVQCRESDSSLGAYLQVHLGFSSGWMALIDYTDRLPPGDGYSSMHVIASHGAAYSDDMQNRQLLFRGGRPQSWLIDESLDQWSEMLQEFVDGLQETRHLTEKLPGWTNAVKVASAVVQSLDQRRAVALSV